MKQNEKTITLGDIFRVLWKNVILLCVVTVLITIVGVIYTYAIAKPTYSSSASINVAVPTTNTDVDYSKSIQATTTVTDSIKENAILEPVVEAYNKEILDEDGNGTFIIPGTDTTISVKGKKSITYKQLADMVSVKHTANTFKITITVSNKDKDLTQYFAASIQEEVIKEAVKEKEDGTKGVFFFAADSVSVSSKAKLGEYTSPNKKLYLIVSFLGGLVLACIIIFIKEFMSNKFKTKEEIEILCNEKVIGLFPDRKEVAKRYSTKEVKLLDLNVKNMEPFNKLVSNIKYANVDNPIKVIEITSTLPNELKSTTAANLAYSIASNNQKVIIVDFDIRKPMLHKTFEVEKENGVVDYCIESISLDKLIKHSKYGVDVITAGKDVLNPISILESEKVKDLISKLKEKYDYVVLDVPPSLACSDSQIISTYSDGVLYTVAINQAKKKDVIECLESLKRVDANIIGVSVTKAESKKKDYYYYSENE